MATQPRETHQIGKAHGAVSARLSYHLRASHTSIKYGGQLPPPGVVQKLFQGIDEGPSAIDDAVGYLRVTGEVTPLQVLLFHQETSHRLGLPIRQSRGGLPQAASDDDGRLVI